MNWSRFQYGSFSILHRSTGWQLFRRSLMMLLLLVVLGGYGTAQLSGQQPGEIDPPVPQGEPQDPNDIPTIVRLEVDQKELSLSESRRVVQLQVIGFSGEEEPYDLTDQVKYDATPKGIVSFSVGGFVAAQSNGETDLYIRYVDEATTNQPLELVVPIEVSGIPEGRIRVNQIGTVGGLNGFTADRWSLLVVDISNSTSEPVKLMVTSTYEFDSSIQFGRRFTVPAYSHRTISYPIRVPSYEDLLKLLGKEEKTDGVKEALTLDIRSALYRGWDEDKQLIPASGGKRFHFTGIRCDPEKPLTGILSEPDAGAKQRELERLNKGSLEEDPPDPVVHLMQAIRRDQGLGNITYPLSSRPPPSSAIAMIAVDQLVISGNRLLDDTAGLLAVRDWLYAGGRLWIMLDKTGMELPERMLGDQFGIHLVDEVPLYELAITETGDEREPLVRLFDEPGMKPAMLSRVLLENQQVTHWVGKWPVACWQRIGQGEVLFTTLSMDAWVQPMSVGDGVNITRPLKSLAKRFLQERQAQVVGQQQLRPFVAEKIGYSIIGRAHVTWVLVVLCVVLSGVGVFYQRHGKLEKLAIVGPLLALIASIYLGVQGASSRYLVPSMAAEVQWIEADPETNQVHVSGIAAVYNQSPSETKMGATHGGVFWPDFEGLEGVSARIIWTDLGQWHWEQLRLPDGVRQMPFSASATLDSMLSVNCRFGPQGLVGDFSLGPFSDFSDALLVSPGGKRLAVTLEEGRIVSAAPLPRGRYFQDNVLSDEQQRRAAIYQQILEPETPHERPFPRQQVLLGWSNRVDVGFRFPDQQEHVGAALVAIPVSLQQTPKGEAFQVPSAALSFRSMPGPLNGGISTAYDNVNGTWISNFTQPKMTWLRFQLPSQVLPAEIEQVVLTVDIDAVGRNLDIAGWAGDEIRSLGIVEAPQGTVTLKLDQRDFLQPDSNGGFWLGVRVSAELQSSPGKPAPDWTIRDVSLSINGRRVGAEDESSSPRGVDR
jgi:hypothetical protein